MSDRAPLLRALADSLAYSYLAQSRPRAILLAGSAASGQVDGWSDIDLLCYYDQVPDLNALAAVREEFAAERFRGIPWPDEDGYSERYFIAGMQCQVGHGTIACFEREIERLVVGLEVDGVLPKIMSGLFEGVPLHGHDLIEHWRQQAAYTEPLQRAMIAKHWNFFPWWYFQDKLRARDATVWRYEVLVQSAYNIIGTLAALNRIYFSAFEFKRATSFLSRLEAAPPNLADRLELLFEADEPTSTSELELLLGETRALVAERFPDLDLGFEWGGSPTPLGARERSWPSEQTEQ
jgi:hypothetical protein